MQSKRMLWIGAFMAVVIGAAGAQTVVFQTNNRLGPGDMQSQRGGYEDVYRVAVTQGRLVEVIVYSDDFDSYVRANLPDGQQIENDDFDGLNAGFVATISRSGTMEIAVSAVFGQGEGNYSVTVTELGEPQTISIGQVVRGTLGGGAQGGPKVVGPTGGRRADYYRLQGNAGERVVIDLRSSDFDAYLELSDPTGFRTSNDDGGEGFNSRLSYEFTQAGHALITARGIGGSVSGSYELQVSRSAQNVGAQYDGVLTPGDNRAYDGKLYDVYEYRGRAGQSISIRLDSNAFDAMLYISNPDGTNLASDDDSGGNNNSLIDTVLPNDGVYRIYVTSFFGGEGPYRVTIFE